MKLEQGRLPRPMRRLFGLAQGRAVAALLLAFMVVMNALTEPLGVAARWPEPLARVVQTLGEPFSGGRLVLFDGLQQAFPRERQNQAVTIVAIDEKSLTQVGQWPWPRNRLADLVKAIGSKSPAAIGLDMFMPEPDQMSPENLAARLWFASDKVREELAALPGNDAVLAEALAKAPTVLGAAGFDFAAPSTSTSLRTRPLVSASGERISKERDPHLFAFVRQYPNVLASMAELQSAASGQALLSVDAAEGAIRRLPMIGAVNGVVVPSLTMEMLRVATGSDAISVESGPTGVRSVEVADLSVPTLPNGEVWLHFAPVDQGMVRYVSALDVLEGRVPAENFKSKLVLIGLTGFGLSDQRMTALGELVPGIEIQAQMIETLFDGRMLTRPIWLKWLEVAVLALFGAALVWFVPRRDSRLAAALKSQPRAAIGLTLLINAAFIGVACALFVFRGLLFDASAYMQVFTILMAVMIGGALIQGLGEAQGKLAGLVDSGIALGRENDRQRLLAQSMAVAREIASCEAVTLHLKTDRDSLRFEMWTGPGELPLTELALHKDDGSPNDSILPVHVALSGRSYVVDDLAKETRFDFSRIGVYQDALGRRIRTLLLVPLKGGNDEVLGVLQLINSVDARSGAPLPFDRKVQGFLEALAAQLAVALQNKSLLAAQEALMDSMIKILAGAIDFKSPYTGGHCERVPELGIMLAQEASKITEGPLADFAFKTDDEWREFRIGAWLHDCGKVTTPDFVVDKATKLETISDRIHEVRMRFEVLLRDAQIERLQAIHQRGEDPAAADAAFQVRKAALEDDFAFVAECNLGGEFMAPERLERLKRLGQTVWMRHFDDRLGIGHEELKRHEREPRAPLPAPEPLLADKPRHLFERPASAALDPKYGFKLKVPQYLYNHGELYNLSVGRGTLTEEDRFKINEHIIQTIVMLEQMPLPPNLKRVPEYAGTHHETLNGSGYPRKLTATELSVPSRIMAIADIFEALTASDRPYKKAKSLSESVKMLAHFRDTQHIDPTLFELFLTSGVYRRYAEKYLKPEQMDEVDISKYLQPAASAAAH